MNLPRWQWSFSLAAALVSVLCVFNAYCVFATLDVFGLDEVHYYPDFTFKLKEEGRWLNFLLHGTLRAISLQTHALLFLFVSWCSFFFLARRAGWNRRYSTLLASVVMLAPPTIHVSLWPATLLPSTLVFLLLVIAVARGVTARFIYPAAGVLLFGAMQSYYFLVPLIFLPELVWRSEGRTWRTLAEHAALWVLGAVIGVLVSLLAVYLLTGQAGIEPAEWRRTMPIHSAGGLWRNTLYVTNAFAHQTRGLWQTFSGGSVLFSIMTALAMIAHALDRRRAAMYIIVLSGVALSFFAFCLPLAPVILERSLVALSCALALLLLVPPVMERTAGGLSAALLVWAACNLSIVGRAYLEQERAQTDALLAQVRRALPTDASNYRAIAVFGKVAPPLREAQRYNSPPWLRPILLTAGANDYWDCRTPSAPCESLATHFSISTQPPADAMHFLGAANNVAVIYFGHN